MENGRIKEEYDGSSFFSLDSEKLASMGLRSFNCPNNYFDDKPGFYTITDRSPKSHVILRDFYYSYGRHSALRISSLELPKNSVIAVTGHNGAGKSTFVKCLCGLQRGFKGKIIIDGITYNSRKMRKMLLLSSKGSISSSIKTVTRCRCQVGKSRESLLRLRSLQKKLIAFDEPTSGLDFKSMESTAELLRSISCDRTVLIVTHDPELIERCCTHILHIEDGQI